MSTTQDLRLDVGEPRPTRADSVVSTRSRLPRALPQGTVRQLILQLSELEDRMRLAPAFLPTDTGRSRALNPEYLELLMEQARVIAALRAVRRRR